ncbi:unnamed protein product, partial [Rotaria sordida]
MPNNQVGPGESDSPDEIPQASTPREPTGPDDPLAEFRQYVNSKLCYHPAALADASVVRQTKKEAYQIDIYTLMEERSMEWKQSPYDNENCPAQGAELFDE